MKLRFFFFIALLLPCTSVLAQEVKVWEETLTLPTYTVDAPEVSPVFDCDWSYQRARRSVYPYVLDDNMTRNKIDKDYKAVYLENKYIKVCILPEIGGRLFYAVDKTNGYDIFYHQDVIKPANVGMLGAWISGGVEWNVFHHHRNTTNLPVNYTVTGNEDGSKTVWIGETEWRHRMSWTLGMTLHPDKSYIEVTGMMMNSTRDDNSTLFWANVATKVDENYQIIFPQNTEFGVFHSKESFCHWPVTHETYNYTEAYQNGIKADWWGAHPVGNSIFIYDLQDDFVAGYDHGQEAGTIIVGNHDIMKGGKFWSWGPYSGWDTNILTENAGHYIELMAGCYSDNQPDYNWNTPYEVKRFTQYMFGLRDMKGVKKSTERVSLNMEVLPDKGRLLVGANATEHFDNVKIRIEKDGEELFCVNTVLAPDVPYVNTVKIDKGIQESELTMTIEDSDGTRLISYTPVVIDADKPLPEPVRAPARPEDIPNNEECYLVGQRAVQFHNPFLNPLDYFEEVVSRDPYDIRSNTALGVYYRKHADYEKAKMHLRRAIKRQTKDYTRPGDCEAMYNLGLILKDEAMLTRDPEMLHAALDTLYRCVWNYEYNSAANFQLAQMYVAGNDMRSARERLEEAVAYNGRNLQARQLMATAARHEGNAGCAKEIAEEIIGFDPLNLYALYELKKLGIDSGFDKIIRNDAEQYLELAIAYHNNGYDEEAVELLEAADAAVEYPTVKIWLGYLKNDKTYYDKALALDTRYCNMFRIETIPVLESVMEYAPDNYKVYYYLGNLFYDKQPLKGMEYWKKVISLKPDFPYAYRNLGFGTWKYLKDPKAAYPLYLKAVELDGTEAFFLEEIDQVAEAAHIDVAERYELLKSHHETCVKRFYPLAAEVITGIFTGDYDRCVNLLRTCYFPTREGVANFHDVFVDALLLAGEKKVSEGEYEEGTALFKEAFTFPVNHQVFNTQPRPRDAQIYWNLYLAYKKSGAKSAAAKALKACAEVDVMKTDYRYFKALALNELGRKDEALAMFSDLVAAGEGAVVEDFVNFFGAEGNTGETVESINTRAYYTAGLGYLGMDIMGKGTGEKAGECFAESVRLKPDNLWSNYFLGKMNLR